MLPEMENVFASLVYISPISTLELIPKTIGIRQVTSRIIFTRRWIGEGVIETEKSGCSGNACECSQVIVQWMIQLHTYRHRNITAAASIEITKSRRDTSVLAKIPFLIQGIVSRQRMVAW